MGVTAWYWAIEERFVSVSREDNDLGRARNQRAWGHRWQDVYSGCVGKAGLCILAGEQYVVDHSPRLGEKQEVGVFSAIKHLATWDFVSIPTEWESKGLSKCHLLEMPMDGH